MSKTPAEKMAAEKAKSLAEWQAKKPYYVAMIAKKTAERELLKFDIVKLMKKVSDIDNATEDRKGEDVNPDSEG